MADEILNDENQVESQSEEVKEEEVVESSDVAEATPEEEVAEISAE